MGTQGGRIRNEVIRDIVKGTPIEDKMSKTRLKRSDHVNRRSAGAPVRRLKGLISLKLEEVGKTKEELKRGD